MKTSASAVVPISPPSGVIEAIACGRSSTVSPDRGGARLLATRVTGEPGVVQSSGSRICSSTARWNVCSVTPATIAPRSWKFVSE